MTLKITKNISGSYTEIGMNRETLKRPNGKAIYDINNLLFNKKILSSYVISNIIIDCSLLLLILVSLDEAGNGGRHEHVIVSINK